MDVLSVPLLQILWPMMAVQALTLHSCSQSSGQVGRYHGSSWLTTLPASDTMCTLDGPKWTRHPRYSKGFPLSHHPVSRETVSGVGGRSALNNSPPLQPAGQPPPNCKQFYFTLPAPGETLTDTSPGTGMHDRRSGKCIYLCYLASSLGQTLLRQRKKPREKKEILCPALSVKQTYLPCPKPAFAGISMPIPVQQVCAYLGMFGYPTLRIFKARGSWN